ncbi:MAG: glycine--tRNA ligase [Candidatus Sumerlaeia bacterium]
MSDLVESNAAAASGAGDEDAAAQAQPSRIEHKPFTLTMDTLVSLCKRRGLIFPGSEIYEGLQGTYDYGPVGVELKNNVKRAWWRAVVYEREDMEGLDAAILMNARVWEASGHVDTFHDPLCDSLGPSRMRYRADHVPPIECTCYQVVDVTDADAPQAIEKGRIWAPTKKKAKEFLEKYWIRFLGLEGRRVRLEEIPGSTRVGRFSPDDGGELTEPRNFNLMFATYVGPVAESAAKVYLRPETAQGIFVNFLNVLNTMRRKLPFGMAQIGKSFRNEITPRNFIFRVREFEQMEIEFFCTPGTDEQWFEHWRSERMAWYTRFGIRAQNLRFRRHDPSELAHYSKDCYDIEYNFPIGWQELEGIANRTDYDLRRHQEFSRKDLTYFDPERGERYIPYVIEPSAGVDRSVLAFLADAYDEQIVDGRERVVLHLHHALAPIKAAVFPLLKNRPELVETARRLARDLQRDWHVRYDDTASIGKLYRRQDEIGTPFGITVDVQSLSDQQVTIRDRDSMKQDRVNIGQVAQYLRDHLNMG